MPNETSVTPLKEGSITIRYAYREGDPEIAWNYRPEPAIPDELAVRILQEVVDRL